MTKIIETIINKDFVEAKNLVDTQLKSIVERKLVEVKKMIAARNLTEQEENFMISRQSDNRKERLKREITEDELNELSKQTMGKYYLKAIEDKEKNSEKRTKGMEMVHKRMDPKFNEKLKEEEENIDEAKMTRREKDAAIRRFMSHDPEAGEKIIAMGKKDRAENKAFASAKKEIQRVKKNNLQELSKKTLGSYVQKASQNWAGRAYNRGKEHGSGTVDFYGPETSASGVNWKNMRKRYKGINKAVEKLTKEEQIDEATPKVFGPGKQGKDNFKRQNEKIRIALKNKAKEEGKKEYIHQGKTYSIDEAKKWEKMLDPQHRIARNTVKNPLKGKFLGGPSAEEAEETLRKKYGYNDKQIEKLKNEEVEQIDEARFKIVKARIRGGKIQRRKKVSTQPGMTFRGGKLIRMSPAEKRRRKLGARKGKLKRRAKMSRILRKRKMSLMKRERLGI